jgi:sedoheptulokinase
MNESFLINVGTGSQVSVFTKSVPDDNSVDCRPLVDGGYILAGSSLCGGRAYAMLERLFREIASSVTGTEVKSAYPMMDAITENFDGGDLLVNTQFSGTRENPEIRGSITNIDTENLTAAALCDGFMYGMANELYEMYFAMKPYTDSKPKFAVGSGNGIRNNKALRKRFERIFKIPLVIPKTREEASFGASLFALVSARVFRDFESAGKLIKYEE